MNLRNCGDINDIGNLPVTFIIYNEIFTPFQFVVLL